MLTRATACLCLWRGASLVGVPRGSQRVSLRVLSNIDTLDSPAADGRRAGEGEAEGGGDEGVAESLGGGPAALPDGAAGVDMFGNPVTAAGDVLGLADEATFEDLDGSVDGASSLLDGEPAPLFEGETAAAVSSAADAFEEDLAGPAATYRESDFSGSEWKVGVLWRDKEKIDVTWIRCKEDGSSEWGWGARGKWRLEDSSFLTFTREFALGWNGKRLFSARVGKDANFVEGVVRGWKPFESATIMGQWQAIRLNVPDRGVAPWFDDDDDAGP